MTTNSGNQDDAIRPTTSSPARQDRIDQIDGQKNDLHAAADYQTRPEDDRSGRAAVPPTENARQAELAAGGSPTDDNRPDAERAFQESRGDRGERDGR